MKKLYENTIQANWYLGLLTGFAIGIAFTSVSFFLIYLLWNY